METDKNLTGELSDIFCVYLEMKHLMPNEVKISLITNTEWTDGEITGKILEAMTEFQYVLLENLYRYSSC